MVELPFQGRNKTVAAAYYLLNSDFPWYSKILVDRPTFAFQTDWRRKHDGCECPLEAKLEGEDVRDAIGKASGSFVDALVGAYAAAGYQPVDRAGAEVLRVCTAITNLSIDDPHQREVDRIYSPRRGDPTLVLEVRDSVSGTLMGKAVDRRIADDGFEGRSFRDRAAADRSNFEPLFRRWAEISADRLARLEARWPMTVTDRREDRKYPRRFDTAAHLLMT